MVRKNVSRVSSSKFEKQKWFCSLVCCLFATFSIFILKLNYVIIIMQIYESAPIFLFLFHTFVIQLNCFCNTFACKFDVSWQCKLFFSSFIMLLHNKSGRWFSRLFCFTFCWLWWRLYMTILYGSYSLLKLVRLAYRCLHCNRQAYHISLFSWKKNIISQFSIPAINKKTLLHIMKITFKLLLALGLICVG